MTLNNCSRLFSCPPFTELRENVDEGLFYCEYEEWAYGLFAILLTILVLMPLIAFFYCFVKSYNKRNSSGYKRMQHQRSVTSYDSRFCDSHDTSYEVLSGRNFNRPPPHHADEISQSLKPKKNGRSNLSSSAPQLSVDGYQSIKPHRGFISDNSSVNVYNKNNMSDGLNGSKCSFCNDTTEIQGIFCEQCGGEGSLKKSNPPIRSCSEDLINHRHHAPSSSTAESVQYPEVTSSRLYPELGDSLNNHPHETTTSYDNNRFAQLSNSSAPELRQKYDQYLLHLVEREAPCKRNGYFTIRDSLSKPNSKVLMLFFSNENQVNENGILCYRVSAHSEGGVAIEGSTMAFSDMDALISYYRLDKDKLPCCLTVMV